MTTNLARCNRIRDGYGYRPERASADSTPHLTASQSALSTWIRSEASKGSTSFLTAGGPGAGALARKLLRCGQDHLDLSYPLILIFQNSIALALEQSGKSAAGMRAGEEIGAFAYSEPRDLLHFDTRIRHESPTSIVVHGEKHCVTGGCIADFFVVYARAENDQLQVVRVNRTDPGVTVEPLVCEGLKAAGFARLHIQSTRLPADRLLETSDGLSHAQRFLNGRRLLLTCGLVGRMRAVLAECGQYALTTERYRQRLAEYSNVQVIVGRMRTLLMASEAVLQSGIAELDRPTPDSCWESKGTAAKVFLTDTAQQFALLALRLLGSYGFLEGSAASRFHRDCAGLIAGAGAQDVLENLLGVEYLSQLERGNKWP